MFNAKDYNDPKKYDAIYRCELCGCTYHKGFTLLDQSGIPYSCWHEDCKGSNGYTGFGRLIGYKQESI